MIHDRLRYLTFFFFYLIWNLLSVTCFPNLTLSRCRICLKPCSRRKNYISCCTLSFVSGFISSEKKQLEWQRPGFRTRFVGFLLAVALLASCVWRQVREVTAWASVQVWLPLRRRKESSHVASCVCSLSLVVFFTGLVYGLSVRGWYQSALQQQQVCLGSHGWFPPVWMKPF